MNSSTLKDTPYIERLLGLKFRSQVELILTIYHYTDPEFIGFFITLRPYHKWSIATIYGPERPILSFKPRQNSKEFTRPCRWWIIIGFSNEDQIHDYEKVFHNTTYVWGGGRRTWQYRPWSKVGVLTAKEEQLSNTVPEKNEVTLWETVFEAAEN